MKRRAGRKRKAVRRQPNGQPYRPPEISPLELAKSWPHRKAYSEQITDHRAECELGRMTIDCIFTQTQYEALVRYREIVGRMRRAIQAPSPNAKSAAAMLVATNGRLVVDLDELDPERAAELYARSMSEYNDAFGVLGDPDFGGTRDIQMAVKHLVIEDCGREHVSVFDVRSGAMILARHFGMLGRARG